MYVQKAVFSLSKADLELIRWNCVIIVGQLYTLYNFKETDKVYVFGDKERSAGSRLFTFRKLGTGVAVQSGRGLI